MKLNAATQLYGVIGAPIAHSRSPALFNSLFQAYRLNKVYLAFEGKDTEKLLHSFAALGGRGLSVTIPHKVTAFHLMDELTPLARRLGAVNTISFENGKWHGANYDGLGALVSLQQLFPDWHHRSTLLIGNGGAARGLALTMRYHFQTTNPLTLLVRNPKKAAPLFNELREAARFVKKNKNTLPSTELRSFDQLKETSLDFELIINTTPLGMTPKETESPLTPKQLPPAGADCVVYEVVYTPLHTTLLKYAAAKRLKTVTGDTMFLAQAALQLKKWTSLTLSLAELRRHF